MYNKRVSSVIKKKSGQGEGEEATTQQIPSLQSREFAGAG